MLDRAASRSVLEKRGRGARKMGNLNASMLVSVTKGKEEFLRRVRGGETRRVAFNAWARELRPIWTEFMRGEYPGATTADLDGEFKMVKSLIWGDWEHAEEREAALERERLRDPEGSQ